MSCGSLRARLLTAALIGATAMPLLAQSGGQAPAQRPATPPAGQPPATAPAPPATPPAAAPQTPPAPGTPAGAQPADPTQTPAFRTGINFVRVDALVTDSKGNAIENLTQDDFEVFEDNKPQKVESFRYIKVEGNPLEGELPRQIRTTWDEETELARDDVRLFVIFYDDYHVRRGSALAVKRQLTDFIRKNVGPMDILGVMYPLTPFSTIGYTRNHEAVIKEIEAWDGRRFDYRARNEFEERYAYYPTEIVERIRNQVSLSALEALVTGLGTKREGRKSVILISEGYSNYLPPQLRDPSAAMPGVGNPNRNRPLVGERTPDERNAEQRAQFFSSTDLLSDLREVFTAANRANCAIYALDPRGLAAFEFDIDQGVGQQMDRAALDAGLDTLRTLADETDGRAILNSNDLVKGLRQMVKDASSYYLLGYTASSPTDGKFKQIRVRVKRPGLQVRARKGYWALSPDDVTAITAAATRVGPAPEIGQALALIETPLRARTIRTWIGTARGENGRTAVTLVWEPAPVASGERREPAAQVAVTAGGQSGAAYFRGKVPSPGAAATGPSPTGTAPSGTAPTGTGPAAAGAAAEAGGGGRVTFQAPPGQLQLRLSVEGAAGQILDSDFRDLVVPDYAKPEPLLSVPAIYRARTQRDVNVLNAAADPRPSTAREFSRTERLHVRFQAYAPGGGTATPTARLLNRAGSRMVDVPVRAAAARGPADFEADVPLASLPAGDYLLEVAMPGEQSPAKQLVAFRVTS
jgi:VWFA-related protein